MEVLLALDAVFESQYVSAASLVCWGCSPLTEGSPARVLCSRWVAGPLTVISHCTAAVQGWLGYVKGLGTEPRNQLGSYCKGRKMETLKP